MTLSMRDQLIRAVSILTEEEAAAILPVIQLLHPSEESTEYDPAQDPAIGFFEGPEDLSERVEEIIEEETRKRGAWTRKDNP
jgi:hypothetical protein